MAVKIDKKKLLAQVTKKYEDAYIKRTKKSKAVLEKSQKYMPGGDTRSSIWFDPYPIWIDKRRAAASPTSMATSTSICKLLHHDDSGARQPQSRRGG